MSKKRKRLNKKYFSRKRKISKRSDNSSKLSGIEKEIITAIFKADAPISLTELQNSAEVNLTSRKEIQETVAELSRRGIIVAAGKKRFRLDSKGSIYSGRIEKNPRGFGFVMDLEPHEPARFLTKDPFLTIGNMASANHGDKVLILIKRIRKDGRPEAEIITILERCTERLPGYFRKGKPPQVIPEDPRYPANIVINHPIDDEVEDNTVVIVEVLPEPSQRGFVQGRLIEVLGAPENIDVQMRMVIENHKLPHLFPDEVLDEASELTFSMDDLDKRYDLRDVCHITIDGETAKDFDDAIAVEKTEKGFRLFVSIADVSHYVKPDTHLDKEAYVRGTSIYFPGRVIPMLPENLSNNLCSLLPHQDRLTFSAILEFDNKGYLLEKKFSKSVICSNQRFTYTTVKDILIDKNKGAREKYADFLPMLENAEKLATILHDRRMKRGSIGFNIPEPDIALNADGTICHIKRKERNFAHQIIEEFMLAANEAVAATFSQAELPFLYRIHELPDNAKVEEFTSFARLLGMQLPSPDGEPSWFAAVLDIARNSPAEYVVNNLLLRTMQQARYDIRNHGHFGLAATDYTHFTSPIRRYPDLLVHRLLTHYLDSDDASGGFSNINLGESGKFLSSRERLAITAERDMNDRLKIFYMEQFIGERFSAVISGITETTIYLELLDLFINGAIEVSILEDDYYLYDIKRYRFIGEITGKAYQIGDQLQAVLIEVDRRRKKIYFAPAE